MKIKLIIVLGLLIAIASCDKTTSGNDFDFSNAINPYIGLDSVKPIKVNQGDSAVVSVTMRTADKNSVTVTYSVSDPVGIADRTILIPPFTLKGKDKFKIPEGIILVPGGSDSAVLSLTKAVRDDGVELTLGRYNDPSSQTLKYIIR